MNRYKIHEPINHPKYLEVGDMVGYNPASIQINRYNCTYWTAAKLRGVGFVYNDTAPVAESSVCILWPNGEVEIRDRSMYMYIGRDRWKFFKAKIALKILRFGR